MGVQAEGPAGLPAWGWESLHDGHPRHLGVRTDTLPRPLCIPGPQQRERRWPSPWLRRPCPVGRSALQLCSAKAKELRGLRISLSSRGRPLAVGGTYTCGTRNKWRTGSETCDSGKHRRSRAKRRVAARWSSGRMSSRASLGRAGSCLRGPGDRSSVSITARPSSQRITALFGPSEDRGRERTLTDGGASPAFTRPFPQRCRVTDRRRRKSMKPCSSSAGHTLVTELAL